jgi:hypothetical protein
MTDWIPVHGEFIQADVIRWQEAVFYKARRRGSRPIKIGTRQVIAEVLREEDQDGFVLLLVRGCEGSSEMVGKPIEMFKKGAQVRRARRTIMRGKPERLAWSDEAARSLLASHFLGNRVSPPSLPSRPSKSNWRKKRPGRPSRKGP